MSDFDQEVVFTDQPVGGITARKLNISWRDNTISSDFVGSKPAIGGVSGTDYLLVLRGDNTYAKVPATALGGGGGTGTGDMLKAVYDTNNNGKVDTCDSLGWASVTGKPTTFPPDSTAMLKSVYDTDNNGKVDTCDSLPYSSLTGAPAIPVPASTIPIMDGTGAVGTGTTYARNDHVHPTDTSRAPLASPVFTGVPAGPTAAAGTSTTQLATTAFVAAAAPVPAPNDANKFLQGTGTTNGAWGCLPVATETNAGFTIPAIGSTVTVTIVSFPYFVPLVGQTVFIMDTVGGGRCMMGEITAVFATAITVINRGYLGTTAAGLTIASKAWLSVLGPGFATANQPGFVPTPPNNTTTFLRGDATFAAIPGGGDMLKSVYDTNGNNIVDAAESVPWTGITGAPTISSGTWTALSYGTGWSEGTTARYRIQVIGAISTVFCEGIIAYASGAAALAFTLPAGARPAVARGCALAGFDSSGDTQLFQATIGTDGTVNITSMVRQNFSWPSATNGSVYLDNLTFAL